MATYNLKYNKDDSVVRHILVGLLADLNSKLSFWRQISNDQRIVVDVPFYYAVSGDEDFLKDNFLFSTVNGENCDPDPTVANGNYERIPRGVVNITSMAVDPAKLVNKRNLGNYNRINENGELGGYVAEFQMIPVVIGVDVVILLSSQLDMFKLTEAIITQMYKANFYHVDAGHLEDGTYRITSEYQMPDDFSQERPVEYGFDDKGNHQVTFGLEINSFIPAFDFEQDTYIQKNVYTYENGNISGDYANPNGQITFLDSDTSAGIQYFGIDRSVWDYNGTEWINTAVNYVPTALDLVGTYTRQTYLSKESNRTANNKRMFTLGPSKLIEGIPTHEQRILGDTYKVTGRDLPFNE